MTNFNVGDWVEKFSGDYKFQGIIIAVAEKTTGETRYNVELKCGCPADGMVHIFSESQLRSWTPPENTIEHLVAKKLLQRREFGLQKYGRGLEHRDDIDFTGWLVHLQEECMDAANYIQVLLGKVEELGKLDNSKEQFNTFTGDSDAKDTNTKGNESR